MMQSCLWLTLLLVGFKHVNLLFVEKSNRVYDYVIVGGGTAGSVVASRLSENPDHSVLVLEAGINDRDHPLIDVPWVLSSLQRTPLTDWEFKSQPQSNACKEMKDRRSLWPFGKMLGGCSSHNYLDYIRDSPYDYDYWRDLGNEGWGYEDVLPYFKKSENNRDPQYAETEYHNTDGPWWIEKNMLSSLGETIVQAAEELGYTRLDVNGASNEGFDTVQHNTRYGRRMNTAAAFLWPNRHRKNLHVMTGAYVTKVIVADKIAMGVHYDKGGEIHNVKAKREVIVSAGAIMSPTILMRSGIGPRDHLDKIGIKVVADLPVGSALEDHVMTFMTFIVNETLSITEKSLTDPMTKFNYVFGGKGDLSTSGIQANGFFRTMSQPKEHKFPYMQSFFWTSLMGNNQAISERMRTSFGVDKEFWEMHDYEHGKEGYTAFIGLQHPRNTGTVRLRSKNLYETPILSLEYLTHPDDIKDIIEGIRLNQALIKTKTMQRIGATYEAPPHKGCVQHEYDSDEYWECYIRHRTLTIYHQSCTCKMSPNEDGVVDNKLRVKGIQNLRVVDASIMPHVTSGNTMAPTVMIAERGADLIKESAK